MALRIPGRFQESALLLNKFVLLPWFAYDDLYLNLQNAFHKTPLEPFIREKSLGIEDDLPIWINSWLAEKKKNILHILLDLVLRVAL